jgi:hypothetical protein
MSGVTITERPSTPRLSPGIPYHISWLDSFYCQLKRLPVPGWLVYLGIGLLFVLIETVVLWSEGTGPLGALSPLHLVFAATPAYLLALIRYLDETAVDALAKMRGFLTISPAEYDRLEFEITSLPREPMRLITLACAGGSLIEIALFSRAYPQFAFSGGPLSSLYNGVALLLTEVLVGGLLFHTIHQFRIVERVLRNLGPIDLFHLGPLYAFSRLTGLTAVGLVLLIYPGIVFYGYPGIGSTPTQPSEWFGISTILSTTALAGFAFAAPLLGLHRRLTHEKSRHLQETASRLRSTFEELNRRVDAGEPREMADLHSTLSSLVMEEAELKQVPTWPWAAETGRWVATAILLPLAIWLAQFVLQRLPFK